MNTKTWYDSQVKESDLTYKMMILIWCHFSNVDPFSYVAFSLVQAYVAFYFRLFCYFFVAVKGLVLCMVQGLEQGWPLILQSPLSIEIESKFRHDMRTTVYVTRHFVCWIRESTLFIWSWSVSDAYNVSFEIIVLGIGIYIDGWSSWHEPSCISNQAEICVT